MPVQICSFIDHVVSLFQLQLFLILHLCLSDPTGPVAHCPGATRRGGTDHTGQWGKCLYRVCVWEWERGKRETAIPFFLSHFSWYIQFLNKHVSQENLSPNKMSLLGWTHAWKRSGLLGWKIMLSTLVWECQYVVLEAWVLIWSTSHYLMIHIFDWLCKVICFYNHNDNTNHKLYLCEHVDIAKSPLMALRLW